MAVNCRRLLIPLLNSSVLLGERLYGVYLISLIIVIVICCLCRVTESDTLPAFDEICKRSARFIVSCVDRDSALVRSIVRYCFTVARYNSFIGSNALFCCDRYKCSLDDLLRSNINLSNFTFASTHHNLISDKMKQTALFLCEMLCIREGIFEFCHGRNFLTRSQVDEIIAFLACE